MKLKKILASILCFVMILSTMCFNVFAEEQPYAEEIDTIEYENFSDAVALMSDTEEDTLTEAKVLLDDDKYFATIKDALWTLSSSDTTVHRLKVLEDIEIDVNYHTYNYPILINGFAVELDLNGKTITADWSEYTGTRKDNALIGVCNGGKLDIIDSVGDGKIINNDNRTDVENRIFWIMTSTATKSIVVNIKGGNFFQNDENTALLYVQGNRPSDNLAQVYVNITGGHFETVDDDFFNAYDGFQHESYITGGTFSHDPTDWEIKLHPDFKAKQNEDGIFEVITWATKIGDDKYDSLAEAVDAANEIDGGAVIVLLADTELGEKLEIKNNITISGENLKVRNNVTTGDEKTITRADDYTGTLFNVNEGATLTLDGGLVIDGANEWTLNEELYNKALNREVTGVTWADLITSEEGAPDATAPMFLVKGDVVANNVTIQNNYSTKDSNNGDYGVFKVEPNAALTMTGATVKHIVTGGANSVAHLSTNSVWTINDGSLITDTFAGKNGGICRNDSGKLVMNGGTIEKNNAINTNGTVVMLYKGSMEMKGGKICSNTGISGTANGRCAPIYGHSTSTFIMIDGEICHNTGISYGGVDVPSSIKVEISGGYVGDNISALGNTNADVNGNANTVITGGTFTQDVSQWVDPDFKLVYDEATKTYGLEDRYVAKLGDNEIKQSEMIKILTEATEASTVSLISDVKVADSLIIDADADITLDLAGYTLNGNILVNAGAKIEIKDGKIVNENADNNAIEALGEVILTNVDATSVRSVVRVDDDGVATINSGSYKVNNKYNMTVSAINASKNAKVTVKDGVFVADGGASEASHAVSSRDSAVVTINGGKFSNGVQGTLSGATKENIVVNGGFFDQDPTAYKADKKDVINTGNSDYPYVVSAKSANKINVELKMVKEGLYNIVLKSADEYDIYEFVSAELTFKDSSVTVGGGEMEYEILGIDKKTTAQRADDEGKEDQFIISIPNANDRKHRLSTDKAKGVEEIVIGQVKFHGQGTVNFSVVDGLVVTTQYGTDLGRYYGANDFLNIEKAKIENGTITKITRDVKVKVAYNHPLINAWDNEEITVTLKDGFNELVISDDGTTKADISDGIAKFDKVRVGRITVTLEAPGFRKYVYETTLEEGTDALVLSFWNNVKRAEADDDGVVIDPKEEIETGKGFMAHNFLVGDIVMDYTVDEYDLAAVTSYYGTYDIENVSKYLKYDLNRDGNIDIIDVHYVLHTLNN